MKPTQPVILNGWALKGPDGKLRWWSLAKTKSVCIGNENLFDAIKYTPVKVRVEEIK